MNTLNNSLAGFSNYVSQRLKENDTYMQLDDEELENKYKNSPLVRKIIEKPIMEGLKNFLSIELTEKIGDKIAELNIERHLKEAVTQCRKYGNIVIIYKDGRPLDTKPTRDFDGFLIESIIESTFTLDDDNNRVYKTEIIENGELVEYEVHKDRYLIIGGLEEDGNKDTSIIEDVLEFVTFLEDSFKVPVSLMHRLQSDIIKLNGLADSMAGCGTEIECQKMYQKLFERMQTSYQLMDSFHLMPIDTEEELTQVTKNITQFDKLQNSLMLMVSAVSEIPMTILFGKSPSGFNSGSHETENWHNFVSREIQSKYFTPILQFIFSHVGINEKIEYASLENISKQDKITLEKDTATVQKTRADIINVLLSNLETPLSDKEILEFINTGKLEKVEDTRV